MLIGDYKSCSLPCLKQATKDYKNIISIFSGIRKYHIVYLNEDNKLQHLNHPISKSSTNDMKSWKFKTKWTCDEIEEFNENVRSNIIQSQKNDDCNFNYNYDSIIYMLSCHGDRDECIYDSNGESMSITFILETFNNANCKQLRQKPKLYFFDTNRISTSITSNSSNVNSDITNDTDMKQQEKNGACKNCQHSHDQSNGRDCDVTITTTPTTPTTPTATIAANASNKTLLQTYTKENHCRQIFGNTTEFAQFGNRSLKSRDMGGILLASLCATISCNKIFFEKDFDEILIDVRYEMAKLVGLPKNVELVALIDHNRMPYKIRFGKKDQKPHAQLKYNELNQFANKESMQQTVCYCVRTCHQMNINVASLNCIRNCLFNCVC